ncbi:MAG: hypothetical protein PHE68_05645 [Candidatus Peribacteraceae bacterium]|nr:hypothetical protein [Candidatus Peribacteraceae bacterium]MDD5074501.1 hypothetical protein [Candidatus Peribacteraceae bacterium]
MTNTRSLRVVLALAFLLNLTWANLFSFAPRMVERLYRLPLVDGLTTYFAMSRGAAFFVLAIISLLALLKPRSFRVMTLVLLIAYFCLFLVDVIVLARGQMSFGVLLPEMVAFVILSGALVRFYPIAQKVEETTVKV